MVELGLSDENLPNLCRLCLQVDDFIVDIFHRLDPNTNKLPLPDRIYELYQVKVAKADGLPTNICHRCLYFTESFTEFRDNVRKCEARLQNYVASIGVLGSVKMLCNGSPSDGIKSELIDTHSVGIEDYSDILPDENSLVTIVDPNQDYNSSDDTFSMDTMDEDFVVSMAREKATKVPEFNDKNISEPPPPSFLNQLTDNRDNTDPMKNVYLCQYCDMAFTEQIECAEHEARHDAAKPHSCNYCPFRCSNRQTVIAHIRQLHDIERPFVCVQCNKGFGRRSDLKKHTIVHTGIRPFNCNICGKKFSRNTNLTKHLRIHSGLKPHVCQKCPRSFSTSADLHRHQRVHNNFRPFKCAKCPSAFTRKDKLLHHERVHLRKEQKAAEVSVINQTDSHNTIKKEPTNFDTEKIVIPLNPFMDLNQADEHIRTITSLKPPVSKLLNKLQQQQQLTPNNMTEHITGDISGDNQNHSNGISGVGQQEKVYYCELCPKKFSLASTLIHHRSTHKGERNHICPVCNKAFMRKRELERHSVIHTGVKPFACKICNKRFNRKDKVVRHEKIHTEDKFNCLHCDMEFLRQDDLDLHTQQHEKNKIHTPEPPPMERHPMEDHRQMIPGLSFRPKLNFYSELKTESVEY